jgi:hypothetical protein
VCGASGVGGVATAPTPFPLAGSIIIYAKTTLHCSTGTSMVVTYRGGGQEGEGGGWQEGEGGGRQEVKG